MGKKNRRAKASAASSSSGSAEVPRQVKREVLEIANQLLDKCTQPIGTGSQEWTDFLEITALVEKIRTKQKGYALQFGNREAAFEPFLAWLQSHGVDTSAISIAKFENEGCGLKANKDIAKEEKFMCIPRKVMITTETAAASCLGGLIKEDRILQAMPNVALALHLVTEMKNAQSFWNPYLAILPDSYTTPLYFTTEEVQLLKGSPLLSEIVNQRRNIARQYAYFYRLFQMAPEGSKLPISDFCYDDYRWAVSTVMTRQNQIPSSANAGESCMALIPLWDMCNHTEGQITTDFNVAQNSSECYALLPFRAGEQIFIYYGPRTNAELLLHNGFVFPGNKNDKMHLRLGVSKNDPLYAMKSDLLMRLSMLPNRIFRLMSGDDPVDSELLAFLRVFNMTEEQLQSHLRGENCSRLMGRLRDFGEIVSEENEVKAWTYLETRAMLMMRAYPTTIQEDEDLLQANHLSANGRNAVLIRLIEKQVLETTQKTAAQEKITLQSGKSTMIKPLTTTENDDIDDELATIDIAAD